MKGYGKMSENNNMSYLRLGYAYVPMQDFSELYDTEDALEHGTLFKELDIPYESYGQKNVWEVIK